MGRRVASVRRFAAARTVRFAEAAARFGRVLVALVRFRALALVRTDFFFAVGREALALALVRDVAVRRERPLARG